MQNVRTGWPGAPPQLPRHADNAGLLRRLGLPTAGGVYAQLLHFVKDNKLLMSDAELEASFPQSGAPTGMVDEYVKVSRRTIQLFQRVAMEPSRSLEQADRRPPSMRASSPAMAAHRQLLGAASDKTRAASVALKGKASKKATRELHDCTSLTHSYSAADFLKAAVCEAARISHFDGEVPGGCASDEFPGLRQLTVLQVVCLRALFPSTLFPSDSWTVEVQGSTLMGRGRADQCFFWPSNPIFEWSVYRETTTCCATSSRAHRLSKVRTDVLSFASILVPYPFIDHVIKSSMSSTSHYSDRSGDASTSADDYFHSAVVQAKSRQSLPSTKLAVGESAALQ